jgi:hypothetical protein
MAVRMRTAKVLSLVGSSKGDFWGMKNFALIDEMKTIPSGPNTTNSCVKPVWKIVPTLKRSNS